MSDGLWLSVYGQPYDPMPAIEAWRAGEVERASQELWDHLYHQGAINSASFAAVELLVHMIEEQGVPDWRAYALIASIEGGRLDHGNPSLPVTLSDSYHAAWGKLLMLALRDLSTAQADVEVRAVLAVVCYAKGQHRLAAITLCTEDEHAEMLGE